MKMIGVIRNTGKKETEEVAEQTASYLSLRGVRCVISKDGRDLPDECECALVLGGDGTLLRSAKVVLDRQMPLLGVNLGTLGYLAEIDVNSVRPALDRLLAGDYALERRMMLSGTVISGGEKKIFDTALNDIVLTRMRPLRTFRFLNYVNREYLNTYTADGVIVSTATGSTGYSLSEGGPIVSPEAEVLLLTPLASHSLISRSIIFSGTDVIRIEIGEGRTGLMRDVASVSFDGEDEWHLGTGDAVEIRRSDKYTNIIKINNVSFLEVLREKMADA